MRAIVQDDFSALNASELEAVAPEDILPHRPRDLHETVRISREAGISIHPPAEDGTKRPLGAWKQHQVEPASDDQVRDWYGPRTGLGWICGAISGGLEGFEFDCLDTYAAFKEAAEAVGLGDLIRRIEAGYSESSPGGGIHWLFRTAEIRGNTKLAQRPGPPDLETGRPTVQVLIETRGEGGYLVVAPSNGKVHPSGGQYRMIDGSIETIITLTSEERESLWALAQTFDQMPKHPEGPARLMSRPPRAASSSQEGTRPGDDYNAQTTWHDLLTSRGWRALYTHGPVTYWRRPGKSEGWSATTNVHGSDLLYVFSTSTQFESRRTYDRFGAYAVLEAGGSLELAAKALSQQGYGSQRPMHRRSTDRRQPEPQASGSGPIDPSVATASEACPQEPNEAATDPHRLARVFMEEHCRHEDGPTIVYHRGEFHLWEQALGSYRAVPEKDARAKLATAIKVEFDRINVQQLDRYASRPRQKPEPKSEGTGTKSRKEKDEGPPEVAKVTNNLVNNVSLALSGYSLVESTFQPPMWLCDEGPFPAEEILPTKNALIHLPSFVAKRPWRLNPSPAFFCPYAVDYDFDPKFGEPSEWLDLLNRKYWPGDPESVMSLQEWFGYHLTTDVSQQKIGMLIGPPRCGKGTIARILSAVIGGANVCNPKLHSLGTQFGSAVLIGKLAAIVTDAQLSGRSDIAQIVENLLSISGQDGQTIPRKHQGDWTGVLKAKFTIMSNDTPLLANTSGALPSRMLIWRFTKSYLGQEDHGLFDKLKPELPGILLWAIDGWKRLRERGHFIQPESAQELVEEMQELSSPVGTFVKEMCDQGPPTTECQIAVKVLFGAWRDWCDHKGRVNVGEETIFGRNLRSVCPHIERKQVRELGRQVPHYRGIRLKG